jgi:hypothetical protein
MHSGDIKYREIKYNLHNQYIVLTELLWWPSTENHYRLLCKQMPVMHSQSRSKQSVLSIARYTHVILIIRFKYLPSYFLSLLDLLV